MDLGCRRWCWRSLLPLPLSECDANIRIRSRSRLNVMVAPLGLLPFDACNQAACFHKFFCPQNENQSEFSFSSGILSMIMNYTFGLRQASV